jgi:3-oxoacyl-[acyl-carrier protein] reductase
MQIDLSGRTRSSPAARAASAAPSPRRSPGAAPPWRSSGATSRAPRRGGGDRPRRARLRRRRGDVAQAARLVADVEAALGACDVLVNNAGLTRDNLLLRLKDDDWDAVIDANLRGAFATIRRRRAA